MCDLLLHSLADTRSSHHLPLSPDFVSVFGVSRNANPIQCVEVRHSTSRQWLRLVGQRHDVQLWSPEPRTPQPAFERLYKEVGWGEEGGNPSWQRLRQVGLTEGEGWIEAVLEPFRKQYLDKMQVRGW